jgi:hypothetical protein
VIASVEEINRIISDTDSIEYYIKDYNIEGVILSVEEKSGFAQLMTIEYKKDEDLFIPQNTDKLKAVTSFWRNMSSNIKQKHDYLVKHCGSIEKGLLMLSKLEEDFNTYKKQFRYLLTCY